MSEMHIIVKIFRENLRNATDTIEKPTPCLREIVILLGSVVLVSVFLPVERKMCVRFCFRE